MATLTEDLVIGDVVKMEERMAFSREVLTLATSQTISLGEVLEPDSAYVKAGAVAGNISAIALEAVTTTSATADILCLVRHGIVDIDRMTLNSLTEADVVTQLKTLGIVPYSESSILETQET